MNKRVSDFCASLLGLVLISPLLLSIGFIIKQEGRGSVFCQGLRVGRWGKPFRIFKFRTMVMDAESIGGLSTADDD